VLAMLSNRNPLSNHRYLKLPLKVKLKVAKEYYKSPRANLGISHWWNENRSSDQEWINGFGMLLVCTIEVLRPPPSSGIKIWNENTS
jgi:hypothetical protein